MVSVSERWSPCCRPRATLLQLARNLGKKSPGVRVECRLGEERVRGALAMRVEGALFHTQSPSLVATTTRMRSRAVAWREGKEGVSKSHARVNKSHTAGDTSVEAEARS